MTRLDVYDTTLRDGLQQEGLALSAADKLSVLRLLDSLGVGYVEGGWPGAIPKDTEFFARAADVELSHATLAAFGSTRRAGIAVEDDPQLRALLDSGAPVVTVVGKAHRRHVEVALRTTPEEGLAMVADTVGFLRAAGRRVFLDAEHLFDGWRFDRDFSAALLRGAADAGAEVLVLCDTNGGMLPGDVTDTVADVVATMPDAVVGVHCHNDSGCGVANSLAGLAAGARHVQGVVNGYGERTGNADLLTVVANLETKLGRAVLPDGGLAELTHVSHTVAEILNVPAQARTPYVGASAFAHKAGLHASAIRLDPQLYQHIEPAAVGNDRRMLVSEMAGRASVELKAAELGQDIAGDPQLIGRVVERVKRAEAAGYAYDAADASFDLLLRAESGQPVSYCEVESWRVFSSSHSTAAVHEAVAGRSSALEELPGGQTEAIVKLRTNGGRLVAVGEGNGPVNALDQAVRAALGRVYPELEKLDLTDFRVRILDSSHGTDAVTRVLLSTADERGTWTTVGVGPNLVEASWEALLDGLTYGLLRAAVDPR